MRTLPQVLFALVVWTLGPAWHCAGQSSPSVSVRLVGGLNEREGRVEVLYEGQWGTICDDGWDARDSGVVCRMLGFIGASRAHNGSYFPAGSPEQTILLDSVNCDGDETTISACQHQGWGVSDCQHREDAGVTCLGEYVSTTTTTTAGPTTTTGPPTICDNPSTDVRLVNPTNGVAWAGRVQVWDGARWYEVCDDFWGLADARVICRMLCYNPDNAQAHLGPDFGNTTEPFLFDDVKCQGDEKSIFNCTRTNDFVHNCLSTEGAGVSCIPDNPPPPPVPDPVIICDAEIISARFDRQANTRLRPEHLTLVNRSGCGYTTNIEDDFISIDIPFIGCETTRAINGSHIIYSNDLHYEVPPLDPEITRVQAYLINVLCVMGRNDDPANAVEPETQTMVPQYGNGHFEVNLNIYESPKFVIALPDFPVKVKLGELVYIGLALRTTDPRLKIVVPRCYTTPEEDPESQPQYLLIEDKCAVEESVIHYPINQTMFGFRFRSFKFQGGYPEVYVHCKAYVCGQDEKDRRCDRSCRFDSSGRRKRDVSSYDTYHQDIIFPNHTIFDRNQGPIVILDDTSLQGISSKAPNPSQSSPDSQSSSAIPKSSTPRMMPGSSDILEEAHVVPDQGKHSSPSGASMVTTNSMIPLISAVVIFLATQQAMPIRF